MFGQMGSISCDHTTSGKEQKVKVDFPEKMSSFFFVTFSTEKAIKKSGTLYHSLKCLNSEIQGCRIISDTSTSLLWASSERFSLVGEWAAAAPSASSNSWSLLDWLLRPGHLSMPVTYAITYWNRHTLHPGYGIMVLYAIVG